MKKQKKKKHVGFNFIHLLVLVFIVVLSYAILFLKANEVAVSLLMRDFKMYLLQDKFTVFVLLVAILGVVICLICAIHSNRKLRNILDGSE